MFSWSFLQRGYAFLKLDKTEQALEDFKRAANLGTTMLRAILRRGEFSGENVDISFKEREEPSTDHRFFL